MMVAAESGVRSLGLVCFDIVTLLFFSSLELWDWRVWRSLLEHLHSSLGANITVSYF